MITIHLSNATNGIIKKVIDTQYNGVDQTVELVNVYEFPESKDDKLNRLQYFVRMVDLLEDITNDLGLDLGSDFDEDQINFELNWGDKYSPSEEEVNERLKELQSEIRDLKEYKKSLRTDDVNI